MAEDNYTEKNVYYETKPIESIKIEIQKKVTALNLNGLHNIFCMYTIYIYVTILTINAKYMFQRTSSYPT